MLKEGDRKGGELMVKRGISAAKREGKTTPSPTWKSLVQDSNFSNTLSARKLGANLWEMEPHLNHRVPKINKNAPILSNHILPAKTVGIPDDPQTISPSKQETTNINFRKQLASSLAQRDARVDKIGQAQQPLSPASCSTSMEMAPRRSAVSPTSSFISNGKVGESSYSLKTSTELLKVLNRIWSLEEKHALDMSLVKTLRRELEQSQAQYQQLVHEKKRDQNEIDHVMKQMTHRKMEQQRINDAVKLVEDKLEDELKLRRHSEKRHHKLAKELSQMKSSFTNVLRELDRERKARILLEDLCDEFAKEIRDYEQEVRFIKHKYCNDQIGREGNDRLILHISEAWLDERAQMKLTDVCDISKQQSALDKLCLEIEAFLREKQSDNSVKNVDMSSKSPSPSRALPHSLESFHLNEPASAPWRGNDEDDSVGMTSHRPQLSRGYSLKQANDSAWQQGDTSDGHNKEMAWPKPINEKVHSRRGSDPCCSQFLLEELGHERKHHHVIEGSTKSRTVNSNEASHPRMSRKGQKSSREGKIRTTDTAAELHDAKTGYPSLTSEGHDSHHVEGFFDPSMFVGPTSPVKKWTSEVSAADPDISESSTRWPNSVKPNTLKAKLIEARLEGQQARTRFSKGVSMVD